MAMVLNVCVCVFSLDYLDYPLLDVHVPGENAYTHKHVCERIYIYL